MSDLARLSDTHCHLNLNQFNEDLESVLARAAQAGVEHILVPGIDLPTSLRAVELAEQHAGLFAAIGIHPNSAKSWESGNIKEIAALCKHPKVVAIGEIGLDYYRHHAAPAQQKAAFQAQLELAQDTQLPVVLHSREAMQDVLLILKNWHGRLLSTRSGLAARPGILHAFEGTLQEAREAAQLNFWIGIGGPITYPNAGHRLEIIKKLPLESILIETDAPYLAPQAHRGERNEPANVKMVVQKMAETLNLNYDQVAKITSESADRLILGSQSH